MEQGGPKNFKDAAGSFSKRVLKLALMIPSGRVTTYGRLARAAGAGPMAAQSITSILGKAYDNGAKNIPFHRIVYANGKVWMNSQYESKRRKLYKQEGIEIDKNGKIVDFEDILI
ncbi:MAG: Methylated-DNA-(protein)-cysteine S-methyltransferase binding protein [Patescibacteria group bacterium]|nr:Methylated-DNA-(protein)-cysteine S-methyltransferase binding protein [Patescibacteria group bacterium]